MTQKELLYLEDAIEHEKNIIIICNDIMDNLNDDDLIRFIKKEIKKHESFKEKLINKMEVMCNE